MYILDFKSIRIIAIRDSLISDSLILLWTFHLNLGGIRTPIICPANKFQDDSIYSFCTLYDNYFNK